MVYACGPEPMLAAVATLATSYGQPCEVSMERTMGCGLGGCYSCVVPVKHADGQTRYVRSCIGGPVFDGATVGVGHDDSWISRSRIGSLKMPNPLIAASGCFGYGLEYDRRRRPLDCSAAWSRRGCSWPSARATGRSASPRRPAGMLNAIGLQGIGVHRFVKPRSCRCCGRATPATIVNICGTTLDEYVEVARVLSDAEGVDAIEINISCPNIKEGGIQFGCSLDGTFDVVSAVRKVTSRCRSSRSSRRTSPRRRRSPSAAEDAGADAISLVNTFLAMAIDVEQQASRSSRTSSAA